VNNKTYPMNSVRFKLSLNAKRERNAKQKISILTTRKQPIVSVSFSI